MKLFRRFLGPPNSLILTYGQFGSDFEAIEKLESQLEEVGQYYQFCKLSELVAGIRAGKPQGFAALVLTEATKGTFLRVLPILLGREVPFTLFVRPDYIGTNRLPQVEELALYREAYPDTFSQSELESWTEKSWWDAEQTAEFLAACRSRIGPLPIDRADPTRFSVTWGKVIDNPPTLMEVGLYLQSDPLGPRPLDATLGFLRRQTKLGIACALTDRELSSESRSRLEAAGITGMIGKKSGAVEKNASPMDLPRWQFEESE